MKKLFVLMLAICAFTFTQAQSAKFNEGMKKAITLLDSAKTADDLQNAANSFERIAGAEKDQWLPYYYGAYALNMKAFFTKDKDQIDAICDKADQMLNMAESLSPANSEITVIKAMMLQARMSVDGSRGMTMGPKATKYLQEAAAQQPANNPRVLMQQAQMKFYTPAMFGGSKEGGIELLKKSIAAYGTFKPETELHPNWGKPYAEGLLKEWSK